VSPTGASELLCMMGEQEVEGWFFIYCKVSYAGIPSVRSSHGELLFVKCES
jgi:hypothetical protein